MKLQELFYAIAKYRTWYDTCSRTEAIDWQNNAVWASQGLDNAICAMTTYDGPVPSEITIRAYDIGDKYEAEIRRMQPFVTCLQSGNKPEFWYVCKDVQTYHKPMNCVGEMLRSGLKLWYLTDRGEWGPMTPAQFATPVDAYNYYRSLPEIRNIYGERI